MIKGDKAMSAGDLSRMFFLDVYQCGAVEIRGRGNAPTGGLPVFSTDTKEQAEALQVRFCRLDRYGSGIYRLNDFSGDVDDLGKVSEMFREHYAKRTAA